MERNINSLKTSGANGDDESLTSTTYFNLETILLTDAFVREIFAHLPCSYRYRFISWPASASPCAMRTAKQL
jgi:hypothetical protein